MNPYATDKILAHPGALEALRAGRSHLTTVHLMPQNLCNHGCSFCVADGTVLVDRGEVPIEDVRVGDVVIVGASRFPVTEVGSRLASDIYEIEVDGGFTIRATGEHPVFTDQGFVGADAISAGDRVATSVRVRMRGGDEGVRARSEMAVEPLPQGPPVSGAQADPGAASSGERSDDGRPQSDEGSGRGCQVHGGAQAAAVPAQRRGEEGGCRCRPSSDAVTGQSDARSGDRCQGDPQATGEQAEVEDGGVVRGVEQEPPPGAGVGRGRTPTDRGQGSGLSPSRDEEGDRGLPEELLQPRRAGDANRGGLRASAGSAVRGGGLGLHGGIHAVSRHVEEGSSLWSSDGAVVLFRDRAVRGLEMRRVVSVRRLWGQRRVYNLRCEGGHAYLVNGVLTHNCSYRMPENKNSQDFDAKSALPWESMVALLMTFRDMGVKGIELTGGGEPLAYPDIVPLLSNLGILEMAVGLVTNGTLYHKLPDGLDQLGENLRWVRVSVDAGTEGTYAGMRKCPTSHFHRALDTIEDLANRRETFHEQFRLGAGFVLSNENIHELEAFVQQAKCAGADNARLSVTFSDAGLDYFNDQRALMNAVEVAQRVTAEYSDDRFTVHNMIPERFDELAEQRQDYKRCPTKDVLCVVEGTGKVYTCCTLTGSLSGLYGNFIEHPGGFRGLWEENEERRQAWDSRIECPVACLYRQRNEAMNALIDNPWVHKEFV